MLSVIRGHWMPAINPPINIHKGYFSKLWAPKLHPPPQVLNLFPLICIASPFTHRPDSNSRLGFVQTPHDEMRSYSLYFLSFLQQNITPPSSTPELFLPRSQRRGINVIMELQIIRSPSCLSRAGTQSTRLCEATDGQ